MEPAGQTFAALPVNAKVQEALREIVWATWDAMQAGRGRPQTIRTIREAR